MQMKKAQIVLFVLVLLLISLIIVSSIMQRSLTGSKTNTVNTDATRAFNAAESGIDELLNKSLADLTMIADSNGTSLQTIQSVDSAQFSERQYTAEWSESGEFNTPNALAKDALLQINFHTYPANTRVNFTSSSCLLLTAISLNGTVNRRLYCGSGAGGIQNASSCNNTSGGNCTVPFVNTGAGTYILLIKVLVANTTVRVRANNFDNISDTRNIRGKSWAMTKSGVRKEIEAVTKTTKDIYPVFDYALYIR
jgi:Tfp pilus assembly protein PilX